jgi:hypothetical protein
VNFPRFFGASGFYVQTSYILVHLLFFSYISTLPTRNRGTSGTLGLPQNKRNPRRLMFESICSKFEFFCNTSRKRAYLSNRKSKLDETGGVGFVSSISTYIAFRAGLGHVFRGSDGFKVNRLIFQGTVSLRITFVGRNLIFANGVGYNFSCERGGGTGDPSTCTIRASALITPPEKSPPPLVVYSVVTFRVRSYQH